MGNMNTDLFGNEIIKDELLRDKFIEPPFSVLDTKTGSWQNRKKQWKRLGIQSEVGRDATSFSTQASSKKYDYMPDVGSDTSIFDPALTELIYHWYAKDGGTILDPFAGGSVRGIVANKLGYKYTGIELRQEQVDSNRYQALNILDVTNQPQWYVGDSRQQLDGFNKKFDFLFSCPPYLDLEVYSDLKEDLSTMDESKFKVAYEEIILKSVNLLCNNSFAVFVVGDVRCKKTGAYKDFIGMTKTAFKKAGALLWNEAILLDPIGTAMLRCNNTFVMGGGKLVKIHQNVLIFKKP
jgi:DNA modification methylase